MACKEMTILYYDNKKDCRTDCDLLGIDRRRVKNEHRDYSKITGHWADPEKTVPIIAYLRVDAELVNKVGPDNLNNVDDESYY